MVTTLHHPGRPVPLRLRFPRAGSAVRLAIAMSHDDSGWRRVLAHAGVYEAVQQILGGRRSVERYVREQVRPVPGVRILDVGCGPASILDVLPPDVIYTGYDANPAYVEHARRRYGDRAEFSCARVGQGGRHPDAGHFDVVMTNSLLHHLHDDEVRTLTAAAQDHLRPGGVLVTIDPVHTNDAPWIARRLVAMDRGGAVRTAEQYRSLLAEGFDRVEDRVVTDLLRVPYAHYLARASRTAG